MNTKAKKPYYCSRRERGASVCGQQCNQCMTHEQAEETPPNGAEHPSATPAIKPTAEQESTQAGPTQEQLDAAAQLEAAEKAEQAGPKVRSQLRITIFEDGNAEMDAPWDRLAFGGLLYLAQEMERTRWAERTREMQRQQVAAVRGQHHRSITDRVRGFFKRAPH